MKKNIIVILTLALLSMNIAQARHHKYSSGINCTSEQGCKDLYSNCQCFCAVKGDYRHKLPKQDHPIFFANKQDDEFGKTCYCAIRDLKILEAQADGMPHYKAVEKYKNYDGPDSDEESIF